MHQNTIEHPFNNSELIRQQLVNYIANTRIGEVPKDKQQCDAKSKLKIYEDRYERIDNIEKIISENDCSSSGDAFFSLKIVEQPIDKILELGKLFASPSIVGLEINLKHLNKKHLEMFSHLLINQKLPPCLKIMFTELDPLHPEVIIQFLNILTEVKQICALDLFIETASYKRSVDNLYDKLFVKLANLIQNTNHLIFTGIQLGNATFKKNITSFQLFCEAIQNIPSTSSRIVDLEFATENFTEKNKKIFLDTIINSPHLTFYSPMSFLQHWKHHDIQIVNTCSARNRMNYFYPRYRDEIKNLFLKDLNECNPYTPPVYQPHSLRFFCGKHIIKQGIEMLTNELSPELISYFEFVNNFNEQENKNACTIL